MLPYAKSREEYSIQDGIIFRGLRIVPPAYLQSHILHILHTDHPGITRMLQLARQYFWWPKVDSDINAFVQRCATCQIYGAKEVNSTFRRGKTLAHFSKEYMLTKRIGKDIVLSFLWILFQNGSIFSISRIYPPPH